MIVRKNRAGGKISRRLAGLVPAAALLAAAPALADERVTTQVYQESEVVRIAGKLGVQAAVSFGEGEQIENVAVGDAEKWQITPNKRANLLFVKPLEATARTNMTVVTNRHTYFFDLVASPDAQPLYMLRFTYAEEQQPATPPSGEAALASRIEAERATLEDDPVASPAADPAMLNFAWERKGDQKVQPVRVYDDGRATYLLWDDKQDVPAILVENEEGEEGPVNFVVRGNTVVIDEVPGTILLRSGKDKASLKNMRESAVPSRAEAARPATRTASEAQTASAPAGVSGIPASSPAAAPSRTPKDAAATGDASTASVSRSETPAVDLSAFDAAFADGVAPAEPNAARVSTPTPNPTQAPMSSDPALLNFAWQQRGATGLLPLHVYDDGHAAYLLWREQQNVPAILIRDRSGKEAPAEFAVRGNAVVITPVPQGIVLRSGRVSARLDNLREPVSPELVAAARAALPSGVAADPALLNFAWERDGTKALLPDRVYDDGRATYLLWRDRRDVPDILAGDEKGKEVPVQSVVRGNTVVIDSVPEHIVLRSGRAQASLANQGGGTAFAASDRN